MEFGRAENLSGQKFGRLLAIERKGTKGKIATWLCKCDCGNIKIVRSADLKRGKTRSCGCLATESKRNNGLRFRKSFGEAAFNTLYCDYQYSAKVRGLSFTLTKKEFAKLTKQNCAYCGTEPNTKINKKTLYGNYVYNGIDRVNNEEGYTLGNSVPCCKFCNYAKKRGTKEEFFSWITRLKTLGR